MPMYHGHKNDLSLLERLLEFCLWTWLFGRWQRNSQLPNKAVICIFNIVSASVKKLEKIYSSSYSIFCYSVTKSCPTLCDPMDCSMPGPLSSTISQSLLKVMSMELAMLSSHLIQCLHLLLLRPIFPSIRVFSIESALCISWPKY